MYCGDETKYFKPGLIIVCINTAYMILLTITPVRHENFARLQHQKRTKDKRRRLTPLDQYLTLFSLCIV